MKGFVSRLPIAVKLAVPLALTVIVVAACGSSGGSTAGAATGNGGGSTKVMTASGAGGTYLVDSSGRTLYLFMGDKGSTSSCSGACASLWPPLTTTSAPTAGSGVNASELSMTSRSDGSKQVTYDGHPLYYYAADSGSSSAKGQGVNDFGGLWWMVAPSGSAITGSGSTPAPAPTTGGGAGGGWS